MLSISEIGTDAQSASVVPPQRLVHAAHEFEAQLMKELLKPMTGNGLQFGGDDESESGSNASLGEFASEALGKALSQSGGFGIASSLIHKLSHSGHRPDIEPVTSNEQEGTGLSATK